ncbi:2-methylaconitate cis-trans isomerase PrpF family protein [Ferroacidibacillus organovorans]|uniref:3-methylitaconate isomerase n=1 Tax=Ferroacidibacillus organovorans TaxID=1765683 RepID=A0A101XPV0_9BACL|nr:PrpF domain-containing protein [Ferroacidibacillus organovorans]KUO95402.1 hypothetical protein ATW55_11155 [Ferroacidibacillus organovorans]
MSEWVSIPCSIYRGGTSKGVFFRGKDLPQDLVKRDRIILYVYGSPDLRQINGLGGATPTTSKVAIVETSRRPNVDVDFTFGQVSIDQPVIDYTPNCGNITSAVGPFAVHQGMVETVGDVATVRIFNTNSQSRITARFPVCNHMIVASGDTEISGVPGKSAEVHLTFHDIGGGVTGKLFPTGNLCDLIRLTDGRSFHVTVLDAGNLTVFVDADELGLKGNEVTENEIAANGSSLEILEEIRQRVGWQLGIFAKNDAVTAETHALPKIAFVQESMDYKTAHGMKIRADDVDVLARVLTMGRLHPAYAVTGAIALSAAAKIEGTLVERKMCRKTHTRDLLRIGHPTGILFVGADVEKVRSENWRIQSASLIRTARPILDGHAWFPSSL